MQNFNDSWHEVIKVTDSMGSQDRDKFC